MSASIERVGRALANMSNHVWAHHSCVITKGGNILTTGINDATYHYHAEQKALWGLPVGASRVVDGTGCTLWSMRFNRTGSLGNARPCPMCERMIRAAGIRTVVYTTPQGFVKMRLRTGEGQ